MSKPEHSWRDFYAIHPAAEFFHRFSSAEQLDQLKADIDKQKVILDPIHTASVFGKTYVIDGISRLDNAERTGRNVVDEKGNWIGMLAGHVVHHPGKTDEEVWDLVISLNLKRRHHDTAQLSEIADKLATRPAGRPWPKNKSLEIDFNQPTVAEAAKMVGVSRASVEQFRKVKREAPDKVEAVRKGKLSVSQAVSELPAKRKSKPKKEPPFEDQVWTWFSRALKNRFGKEHQEKQVMEVLAKLLTAEVERVTYTVKRSHDITAAKAKP